mgnify:CR=1 FL=1
MGAGRNHQHFVAGGQYVDFFSLEGALSYLALEVQVIAASGEDLDRIWKVKLLHGGTPFIAVNVNDCQSSERYREVCIGMPSQCFLYQRDIIGRAIHTVRKEIRQGVLAG